VQNDEYYATVADKAALYAYNTIRGHVFVDGNKRTGTAAAMVFLEHNGWPVDASNEDVENCALGVATGAITRDMLTDWFDSRIG
jgi:death on curing protein